MSVHPLVTLGSRLCGNNNMRKSLLRNNGGSGCLPLKLFTLCKSCSVWEVGHGPNNNSNEPALVHSVTTHKLSHLLDFDWLKRRLADTQETCRNAKPKLFKKLKCLLLMTKCHVPMSYSRMSCCSHIVRCFGWRCVFFIQEILKRALCLSQQLQGWVCVLRECMTRLTVSICVCMRSCLSVCTLTNKLIGL